MASRGGLSLIFRVVLVWLITAGTLMLLSALLDDFHVEDWRVALVSAALIGLINALVWPLLIRVALPLTVLTLGLGVLVLNGAVVLAVSAIEPGLTVDGLCAGIVVALGLTVVNTLVTSLLAIDDDDFWYRNVVKRRAKKLRATGDFDVPGVYFLEIDGLAHDVLRRAIRDGNAPNLARWLRDGSHHLFGWETDWSSQTGACQAGLLHGNNHDMPAFRWWEKDRGAPIVTNHPQGRRGDRAAPLQRARPAARGRGEPRQHRLRRRRPHAAHDEHRARPEPPGPDRPGLLRVLREPLQRHAHDRAGDRRHRAGAPLRGPAAAAGRAPAHRARPQVRARARLGHRDPDRPPGAAR